MVLKFCSTNLHPVGIPNKQNRIVTPSGILVHRNFFDQSTVTTSLPLTCYTKKGPLIQKEEKAIFQHFNPYFVGKIKWCTTLTIGVMVIMLILN